MYQILSEIKSYNCDRLNTHTEFNAGSKLSCTSFHSVLLITLYFIPSSSICAQGRATNMKLARWGEKDFEEDDYRLGVELSTSESGISVKVSKVTTSQYYATYISTAN